MLQPLRKVFIQKADAEDAAADLQAGLQPVVMGRPAADPVALQQIKELLRLAAQPDAPFVEPADLDCRQRALPALRGRELEVAVQVALGRTQALEVDLGEQQAAAVGELQMDVLMAGRRYPQAQ